MSKEKLDMMVEGGKAVAEHPFGFELEHVEVDLEPFKERDKIGFFLREFIKSYEVITYRWGRGDNPEYSTVVYRNLPRESCMQPIEARSELITGKTSKTIEEAVQFHYDAINYLKEK